MSTDSSTRDLLDSDDDVDLMEHDSNPTSDERAKEMTRSYQRMTKVPQTGRSPDAAGATAADRDDSAVNAVHCTAGDVCGLREDI